MREWLSGRASPCQGERRGFESHLPLQIWRYSQVVRQRSAKPLSPGSNPGGASILKPLESSVSKGFNFNMVFKIENAPFVFLKCTEGQKYKKMLLVANRRLF